MYIQPAARRMRHMSTDETQHADSPRLALHHTDPGHDHSPMDCIVAIRQVADECQYHEDSDRQTPTRREFDSSDSIDVTYRDIKHYFGDWNTAVHVAGFTPNTSYDVGRETLIDALQVAAVMAEKPPTCGDIDEYTPFSASIYIKRFDSLEQARAEAGVDSLGMAVVNGDLDPDRVMELAGGSLD